MDIKEINKLKVGDKIRINAVHPTRGRVKGTRIIRKVLNHKDSTTKGYPYLAVNRIIINCFNESYQLTVGDTIELIENAKSIPQKKMEKLDVTLEKKKMEKLFEGWI